MSDNRKVVSMSELREDNRLATPTTTLHSAISELESGQVKANKAMVILLDDSAGLYTPQFRMSNLSMTEALALLEITKAQLLQRMGL